MLEIVHRIGHFKHSLSRYDAEVSHRRWLDELGPLRVWAGNIGAHQVGQSSLGYRLRDASDLKSETVKLLQRMLQVLQNLNEVINEEDDKVEDDDLMSEISDIELDEEDSETTEVQLIYQMLVDIISLLFKISMAIRKPSDHDRLLGIKNKDTLPQTTPEKNPICR